MLIGTLLEYLRQNDDRVARLWVQKVRKAGNLKKYKMLGDAELLGINKALFKNLSLWIAGETDKNRLGEYFVDLGKLRRREGFPLSDVSFAMLLVQRTLFDCLTEPPEADNALALSRTMDVIRQTADFFFLGFYYLTKGYLEDTYVAFNREELLPSDVLNKYFPDDFYFK